jgi:hypothetical protein
MEFFVYETDETVRARRLPFVIITSNNEKGLPTRSCAAASSTTSGFPTRHHAGDRRCALPRYQAVPGDRGIAERFIGRMRAKVHSRRSGFRLV